MPSCRSDGIASPTSSALDQLEHLVAGLALLRHMRHQLAARRRRRSRAPVCGSKKWKRAGVDRELDAVADPRAPCAASTRAVNSALRSAGSPPPSPASSTSAVIERRVDGEEDVRVGAELLEHLDPDRRSSAGPARTPRPRSPPAGSRARPARAAGGAVAGERHAVLPEARPSSPSTVASTRFIAGEPMKAATNRSSGRS